MAWPKSGLSPCAPDAASGALAHRGPLQNHQLAGWQRWQPVFELRPGVYNDETLIEFLSDVNDIEQRAVLLIWDGLPAHRCRRMSGWVQSQRHWLSVEQLPGYAPDLNPLEQAWGNLKSRELANLCSATIHEVATIAEGGLDRIGTDADLCLEFIRHSGLRL